MNKTVPTRFRRSLLASSLSVVALVGAVLWFTTPGEQPGSDPEAGTETQASAGSVANTLPASEAEPVYITASEHQGEPLAPSLEGTHIDGHLRADAAGNLIVDLATRDLFDYFLNTVGEVPEGEAIDAIRALARDHLPETAVMQAMELLMHYIDYKEQAVEISSQPVDPELVQDPQGRLEVLEQALDDMKHARRAAMPSHAAEAFFSMEEAYSDFTLERLSIEADDSLSVAEKQQQIRLAREALPDPIQETERNIEQTEQRQQQIAQAIEQADSPEQAGEALRQLDLDADQIDDVVARMRTDARFERRYTDYRNSRDTVLDSGLGAEERQAALEDLRREHFDTEDGRSKARFLDMDG